MYTLNYTRCNAENAKEFYEEFCAFFSGKDTVFHTYDLAAPGAAPTKTRNCRSASPPHVRAGWPPTPRSTTTTPRTKSIGG